MVRIGSMIGAGNEAVVHCPLQVAKKRLERVIIRPSPVPDGTARREKSAFPQATENKSRFSGPVKAMALGMTSTEGFSATCQRDRIFGYHTPRKKGISILGCTRSASRVETSTSSMQLRTGGISPSLKMRSFTRARASSYENAVTPHPGPQPAVRAIDGGSSNSNQYL